MEATEVTLLSSEWRSKVEGVSTIIRELAIQLAKHPSLHVSVYLPKCGDEDKRVAASYNVQLIEAEEMVGYKPVDWLSVLPKDHAVDYVIGHGIDLGLQVYRLLNDIMIASGFRLFIMFLKSLVRTNTIQMQFLEQTKCNRLR